MAATPAHRTVMLYATVDTFNLDQGAVALALAVCGATGGSLTAFLANLDANAPTGESGRTFVEMETEFRQRAEQNAANAVALQEAGARCGVAVDPDTLLDHSRGVVDCLADHARLHDLLVIGADGSGLLSDRVVAENVLFRIGRPMLVSPGGWSGQFAPTTIAVGWDNSAVSARALFDALSLFSAAREVVLLTIGGEKAIDTGLEEAEAVATLERRGLVARIVRRELHKRTIGDALQDEARDVGAGMLTMGGYGHSRLRDFILGGATLSVLAEPRMPVLLSH